MMMNSSNGQRQQGVIAVWVAVMMLALLGMAAISIDVQRLALAKQDLQDAVDAVALASAATLRDGMDVDRAKQVAIDIAAANSVLGKSVLLDPDVDVEVGAWDAETEQIVPWSPTFTNAAVQVTARCTDDSPNGAIPMIFAPAFGLDSVPMQATAACSVSVSTLPRSAVEIMVVQDGSGSFEEEWGQAIDADFSLVQLVNNVSIADDSTGFVAFNDDIMQYGYWSWGGWWWWEWVGDDLALELTPYEEGAELPDEVEEIYEYASGADPNGYTNPGIALDWAIDEFLTNGNSACEQVIVLVSDGMPFGSTPSKTQQYRDYAIEQANRAESNGIRIHTITLTAEEHGEYGYGGADFEFNESLCRNGGYAFRTHDPEHLQDLLIAVGNIEVGHPCLFK